MGGGGLEEGVVGEADGPLHVGLAGAEPDIADDDVAEGDGVGAVHDEVGRVGLDGHRGEVDAPVAVAVGLGGEGLAAEGDGDLLAAAGGAPDRDDGLALEDGVVGEDGGELHLGAERGGEGEGGAEGECEQEVSTEAHGGKCAAD